MPKLTAGVVLRHPSTGQVEFLSEGSNLPEWAYDLVGEHVLDEAPPRQDATEQFNPAEHNVEAVVEYLAGLSDDDPAARDAEVARVVEAEKAGKNRSTLLEAVEGSPSTPS
ncbi:hypothetical protein [Auraticoccus monumenti]|uniref:Uncharacterized protein n=1 Tax=Auraticoccus monumenti TaxID=675864 RepID=A0A1G6UIV0_9ACTN|nr:hypothetical protein [Auraticoccus monumenti]SDD41184.1 hypothetical protein SAMN04489747_0895 [Auraticoccus monumenti]